MHHKELIGLKKLGYLLHIVDSNSHVASHSV
jgi:hypothetical protein